MPTTTRRRIVRRAVMALAVVLLLPVGYIAGLSTGSFTIGTGILSPTMIDVVRAFYIPMGWYWKAELPGTDTLMWIESESFHAGKRLAD